MAKILLVEDDNNLRDIYGERLLAEGYDIISASDGEEALQMAAQQKPDLIISDVMMPKISGFDMLDILRQTPETKDIRIIMMTALSQAEDKSRADKLGADKYLVKSQVTLEDVTRVVHDILGDGEAEPEATPEPTVPAEPVTPDPVATPSEPAAPVVPEPAAPVAAPAPAPVAPVVPEPVAPVAAPAPAPVTPDPVATPSEPAAPVVPEPTAPAPEPVAPVVNPISSGSTATTTSASPASTDEINIASSSDNELAEVAQQIESFVAQDGQTAEHEEPVKEPTEQDLVHAQNASEDPKVVAARTAGQTQSAPQAPATEQVAPVITNPNPTVPPITPQMDAGNPEPASNRKKIIQPINDTSAPDIHKLYEQEMADQAASTGMVTPDNPASAAEQAPTQTDANQDESPRLQEEQVINPIVGDQTPPPEEYTPPPLETMDANQITGAPTDPDEDFATANPAQPLGTTSEATPTPEITQAPASALDGTQDNEASADPNDPKNIAL